MTLTFKVYPKNGLVLEGSETQLLTLLEQGIIEETNDGRAQFTGDFKLAKLRSNDKAMEVFIVEQWQPLFPSEKVQATNIPPYYVSGNTKQCNRYMKEFLKMHKDKYDFDCIFIATAAYLCDKAHNSFNGTSKNFNFIRKELENWCDEYLRNPQGTFNQAKRYYEYVKRAATRQRKTHVSRAGFGLSAITGRGDALAIGGSSAPKLEPTSGGSEGSGNGHIRPTTTLKIKSNGVTVNPAHKR